MSLKQAVAPGSDDLDPRLSVPENVGLRLRYARMIQGLTLKQISKQLKVDNTTLGGWELGKNAVLGKDTPKARNEMMLQLSQLLNVRKEWLETGQPPMARPAFAPLAEFDTEQVFHRLQRKSAKGHNYIVPDDESDARLKGRKAFWLRMRFWRKAQELSQAAAAERLNISLGGYVHWEAHPDLKGSTTPSSATMRDIAKAMEVHYEWLREGALPMSAKVAQDSPAHYGPSGLVGEDKIGERIRYARERFTNFSQATLGTHLGFSTGAASLWENGRTRPRRHTIAPLAKALTVTPRWLKSGEGQMRVDSVLNKSAPEPQQEAPQEAPAATNGNGTGHITHVALNEATGEHVRFLADQLHRARQRLEQAQDEVESLTLRLVESIRQDPRIPI